MHYKNGRKAENGDKVILFPTWGSPVVGILYDAIAGNDACNGKIAPMSPTDPCPNLQEVLHFDDVAEVVASGGIPDSTGPDPRIAPPMPLTPTEQAINLGAP